MQMDLIIKKKKKTLKNQLKNQLKKQLKKTNTRYTHSNGYTTI